MASSLDSLVSNLVQGGRKLFGIDQDLLTRKGVYPYEYMDRFMETSLPPIEKFYSRLNGTGIGQEDYEHATKV